MSHRNRRAAYQARQAAAAARAAAAEAAKEATAREAAAQSALQTEALVEAIRGIRTAVQVNAMNNAFPSSVELAANDYLIRRFTKL